MANKLYQPIFMYSEKDINSAIKSNDEKKLNLIPLSVGEYCNDWKQAQSICLKIANNDNPKIRANAILGLSYIARNQKKLSKKVLKVLKREYLSNINYHGNICESIDDILLFLNWKKPLWYN